MLSIVEHTGSYAHTLWQPCLWSRDGVRVCTEIDGEVLECAWCHLHVPENLQLCHVCVLRCVEVIEPQLHVCPVHVNRDRRTTCRICNSVRDCHPVGIAVTLHLQSPATFASCSCMNKFHLRDALQHRGLDIRSGSLRRHEIARSDALCSELFMCAVWLHQCLHEREDKVLAVCRCFCNLRLSFA